MDRLHAMRVFTTIIDRRSLSATAESLGISLPSVSRRLSSLERELGVRLIARTTPPRLSLIASLPLSAKVDN